MRSPILAILAIIVMASMIVPIQGTESSDATHANVVAFYKVDDEHYIKSVQAWDYNGYVIATRDLPKLDAGCDYYRCSMPAPGGWCDPDTVRWDPTTPMTSPSSIYIWSAAEMEKHRDPPPTPTPPRAPTTAPDKGSDMTGIIILTVAGAVILGAFGLVAIRRK